MKRTNGEKTKTSSAGKPKRAWVPFAWVSIAFVLAAAIIASAWKYQAWLDFVAEMLGK